MKVTRDFFYDVMFTNKYDVVQKSLDEHLYHEENLYVWERSQDKDEDPKFIVTMSITCGKTEVKLTGSSSDQAEYDEFINNVKEAA